MHTHKFSAFGGVEQCLMAMIYGNEPEHVDGHEIFKSNHGIIEKHWENMANDKNLE